MLTTDKPLTTKHVIVVDDEQAITQSIKRVLRPSGATITCFTSPQEALEFIQQTDVDMIITDYKMPAMTGIEFLRECRNTLPDCPTLMISAFRDFDAVANAFNEGIVDQFMNKPWDNAKLLHSVTHRLSLGAQLEVEKKQQHEPFHGMISNDDAMHMLFKQIQRAACANAPVFIHGESGTGKELVAKACHAESFQHDSPFIAVNCANFSENLMEAQLFGYRKGAFTGADKTTPGLFEAAGNGTLFLDEITTLDLALQAKLLRVLQEREFSPLGTHETKSFEANIITASSTSLMKAVENGEFREDLYYRLYVIGLNLPPLRERGHDVSILTSHFLSHFNQQTASEIRISSEGLSAMEAFSWPGNVRQLENFVQSVVAMSPGDSADGNFISGLLNDRAVAAPSVSPSASLN